MGLQPRTVRNKLKSLEQLVCIRGFSVLHRDMNSEVSGIVTFS
jgi:hypothetical protein